GCVVSCSEPRSNAVPPASKAVPQGASVESLKTHWIGDRDARTPVILLLHGFGAEGTDLIPLARALSADTAYRYLVAEAPVALPQGGRAWWHIDFAARQARLERGEGLDLRQETPEALPKARALVTSLIEKTRRELGLKPRELALVGFSQGAMLSFDTALHLAEPPACVGLLSGTFLSEATWRPRFAARRNVPVFMSHGSHDPILPFALSEALRDELTQQDRKSGV